MQNVLLPAARVRSSAQLLCARTRQSDPRRSRSRALLAAPLLGLLALPLGCRAASETQETASAGRGATPGTGGASGSGGGAGRAGHAGHGGETPSGGTGGTSGAAGTAGSSGKAGGAGSAGAAGQTGTGCGYEARGKVLQIGADIELCLPPVVCNAETCPPPLGDCVAGVCQFHGDYRGLATLPEAWATHYCDLAGQGCHGVSQLEFPEVTAQKLATALGHPLCGNAKAGDARCIGIVASPPMMVGNSELAVDPTSGERAYPWGLGMTEASGLCYEVSGPGGTALVAVTDRCGGYCTCKGSGMQECGPCVNAEDMSPGCACVGTVPDLHGECCGRGCSTVKQDCDWCASNNHPHFDLDVDAFNWVCGADRVNGSCRLSRARFVPCTTPMPAWPPGGGACKANAFDCSGAAAPHSERVPGSTCCCNWNQCPLPGGACGVSPDASCKTGSCPCGAGKPDGDHPQVPSTGCCCVFGTTPQADGTCG